MIKDLFRAFRIEPEERPWMASFGGAILFGVFASVLSANLVMSFVVKRVGIELLPYYLVLGSVALFASYVLMRRVLHTWHTADQGLISMCFALLGTAFLAATQGSLDRGSAAWRIAVFIVVAAFTNGATLRIALDKIKVAAADLFDQEQMKRLYPLLITVSVAAAFVSGMLLALVGKEWRASVLFWLPPAALCIAVASYARLRRQVADRTAYIVGDGKTPTSIKDGQLGAFVGLLSIMIGLSVIFENLFQYQYTAAANDYFPTEAAFNAFAGAYSAAASLGMVLFVNLLLRPLLGRLGLGKSLRVPPLVVLAGAAASVVHPVFPLVVSTVFLRDVSIALQLGSYRVMLEGVSDYQRSSIWAWLDGPVTAVGGLIGSAIIGLAALLLAGFPVAVTVRAVGITAVLLLVFRLFLNERLRRRFPLVLFDSLKKGDFKTRLRAMAAMAEFRFLKDKHLGAVLDVLRDEGEPAAMRVEAVRTVAAIQDPSCLRLVSRFFTHADDGLRQAAVEAVASFRFDESAAFEIGFSRQMLMTKLREAFDRETVPDIANAILRALLALHDPELVPFIVHGLRTGSPTVQNSCLRCLRRFHDPAVIDQARPFLTSADPALKAQAVAATWQFAWEHGALTAQALDELVHAPATSEARRQGLYLIGELRLLERRSELFKGLRAEGPDLRLTAAIALLKLGDRSGLKVIEEAMAEGNALQARRAERLAANERVPAVDRQRLKDMMHAYHLHYPSDLPASEPLRVRLVDIPKKCLQALVPLYAGKDAYSDRRKIEKALTRKDFPPVMGHVVLIGLGGPWERMVQIALLSQGYLVRREERGEAAQRDERVIGMAGDKGLPSNAVLLTDKTDGLGPFDVMRGHYAPSEVLRILRQKNDHDGR